MGRYRVREGLHKDLQGKEYTKGQIVVSDLPLDTMFLEKFDKIDEVVVPSFMAPPATAANATMQLADLSPQLHSTPASTPVAPPPADDGPPATTPFGKLANGDFSSLMGNTHYAVYSQKVGTGRNAKEGYTLVYADAVEIPLNEDPLTRDKMDALLAERLAAPDAGPAV